MIGEAQPPMHKMEYCRRILDRAEALGVGQVYTFAAMAVDVHPREPSRVFGVATSRDGLEALRKQRIEILETGRITGMNGIFLAAAAERGIPGLCLLGAMPSFATGVPYPKASHAVLDAFTRLTETSVDLRELEEYGHAIEQQLIVGIEKIKEALKGQENAPAEKSEAAETEPDEPPVEAPQTGVSAEDREARRGALRAGRSGPVERPSCSSANSTGWASSRSTRTASSTCSAEALSSEKTHHKVTRHKREYFVIFVLCVER
jgi:hypothetical protein